MLCLLVAMATAWQAAVLFPPGVGTLPVRDCHPSQWEKQGQLCILTVEDGFWLENDGLLGRLGKIVLCLGKIVLCLGEIHQMGFLFPMGESASMCPP